MYNMSGIPNKMLPVAVEMLPEGYRRLEYLESTRAQWIDTGIKLSNESEVRCEFMETDKAPNSAALYGDETNTSARFSAFLKVGTSGMWARWDFAAQMVSYMNPLELMTKYKSVHNATGVSLNGMQVVSFAEAKTFETGATLTLFGNRNVHLSLVRIYSFSISRNGQLQLNLIPCLDDKGKPCMFDTVSHKPLYNKGTGEFLYRLPGDGELPAGYTRMEYLESTGTQYIDTGVKLSSESEVLCKGTWAKQRNVVAFVYGARQLYYVEAFTFLANDGSGNSRFQYNEQLITIDSIDGDFEIKQSGNLCFLNDNLITTFQEDVFETPVSAFLFYVNEQRSSGYTPCICKIHSFSISQAGSLQRNFIPCLDDKGVPCMFDTVTRRPFRNAATTGPDFLYG